MPGGGAHAARPIFGERQGLCPIRATAQRRVAPHPCINTLLGRIAAVWLRRLALTRCRTQAFAVDGMADLDLHALPVRTRRHRHR